MHTGTATKTEPGVNMRANVEAMTQTGEESSGNLVVMETRFGTLSLNAAKKVFFPLGLLGLPDCQNYCLTNFPENRNQQFKIMQSLEDKNVTFAVLPNSSLVAGVDNADLLAAAASFGIEENNLVALLIVSVLSIAGETKLSANLRAPVLVDSSRQVGFQFVFPDNKYQVQHRLNN